MQRNGLFEFFEAAGASDTSTYTRFEHPTLCARVIYFVLRPTAVAFTCGPRPGPRSHLCLAFLGCRPGAASPRSPS